MQDGGGTSTWLWADRAFAERPFCRDVPAGLLARRTSTPRTQQLTAYRAKRRAEAQALTADFAQQSERLEQILRHLPFRDLSTSALLTLIDASAEQPRARHARFFGRATPHGRR